MLMHIRSQLKNDQQIKMERYVDEQNYEGIKKDVIGNISKIKIKIIII